MSDTVDLNELKFLDILLNNFPNDREFVFFDVGANVGDYTSYILKNYTGEYSGHLFEPIPELFDKLNNMFHLPTGLIKINNHAVDYQTDTRDFFKHNITVLSSLSGRIGGKKIKINTISLTDYVEKNNIQHIDLLKIDTEGNDKIIIDSCIPMFNDNKISIIQFEYGGTWKGKGWPGGNIYEVFDLLSQQDFSFYSNRGEIKRIDRYTFKNDYTSDNIIAIHNSVTFLDEITRKV